VRKRESKKKNDTNFKLTNWKYRYILELHDGTCKRCWRCCFVIKFLQEGVVDDDVIVSVFLLPREIPFLFPLLLFFSSSSSHILQSPWKLSSCDWRQLRQQQRPSSCQPLLWQWLSSSRVIMETMTRLFFFSEVVTREEIREGWDGRSNKKEIRKWWVPTATALTNCHTATF